MRKHEIISNPLIWVVFYPWHVGHTALHALLVQLRATHMTV